MMKALVGFDDLAIEARGLHVAGGLAQLDELAVLHHRDRLAGELSGGDALDVGREPLEILKDRTVTGRERIESVQRVAQFVQASLDERVVPGLVAGLARERELEGDAARHRKPNRRDLAGLNFVLE